ncbi:hypothetical protein C0J52_23329 [Blattella germanica]|nr:hypothetical protein C0J52_23329 [Blattella germanica]
MPPSKRKCVFNSELQSLYPFLKRGKTDSDVHCQKCSALFSIANGGKYEITWHQETAKHKSADTAAASSVTISIFFLSKDFGPKENKLAAAEACLAFHTVQHNQSFRSADCSSKLVKKCFDSQYSCPRTKSEAIITNQ